MRWIVLELLADFVSQFLNLIQQGAYNRNKAEYYRLVNLFEFPRSSETRLLQRFIYECSLPLVRIALLMEKLSEVFQGSSSRFLWCGITLQKCQSYLPV